MKGKIYFANDLMIYHLSLGSRNCGFFSFFFFSFFPILSKGITHLISFRRKSDNSLQELENLKIGDKCKSPIAIVHVKNNNCLDQVFRGRSTELG